ncbi:putative periplasmic lipoprotein [Pseudomonas aeruginosa]
MKALSILFVSALYLAGCESAPVEPMSTKAVPLPKNDEVIMNEAVQEDGSRKCHITRTSLQISSKGNQPKGHVRTPSFKREWISVDGPCPTLEALVDKATHKLK